ncbi:MAG: AraC family transcriptional regulator [Cytophagales bacterium]|nr:AraC family transcriptional regulator [Cytophagales bacterium]
MLSVYFTFSEYKTPYIGSPRRYEHNFELIYFLQGRGECVIGDYVGDFKEHDLFLIGPNLNPYWHNDNFYEKYGISAHYLLLQYDKQILDIAMQTPDTQQPLIHLLQSSYAGIYFEKNTSTLVSKYMKSGINSKGLPSIIWFYSILNALANASGTILASTNYEAKNSSNELKRIDKVYDYMLKNYTRDIPLHEVSSLIGLSNSAFCQYFKRQTGKTFFDALLGIRMGKVNNLLTQSDMPIADIAYICGFNNLSNFNRQYKTYKGMTPIAYRKLYHEVMIKSRY